MPVNHRNATTQHSPIVATEAVLQLLQIHAIAARSRTAGNNDASAPVSRELLLKAGRVARVLLDLPDQGGDATSTAQALQIAILILQDLLGD